MPQTLGAFLSIMTVMLFAVNFQQATLNKYRSIISSEMEVMASAVASETMEYIAAKPYDVTISEGTVTPFNPDLSLLTPMSDFGSGTLFADAADIDDFNNMEPRFVNYETGGGASVRMRVLATVSYVDLAGIASSTPSWTKRVTVIVDCPNDLGQSFMIRPVMLTREFSPQWY